MGVLPEARDPAESKFLKDADYDWSELWDYHYDYAEDEIDTLREFEEEQETYRRSLKTLAVVVVMVLFTSSCVLCPCLKIPFKIIRHIFRKFLTFKFGKMGKVFPCLRLVAFLMKFPFVYPWAWLMCRANGWGDDVSYYFMYNHCRKQGTTPPDYEDYKRYKNSMPKEGRRITYSILFEFM